MRWSVNKLQEHRMKKTTYWQCGAQHTIQADSTPGDVVDAQTGGVVVMITVAKVIAEGEAITTNNNRIK